MKLSEAGIELITSFEGLGLTAYKCQAGVWTIGYGHTGNVKRGDKITKEQALEYFRKDVKRFEDAVLQSVTAPLRQYQFDALVSLAFNIGAGAFRKSTLLKYLNQRLYATAAEQFGKWNKAGGVVSKGLVRRRHAEYLMFLGLAEDRA
jgi:lysozyme